MTIRKILVPVSGAAGDRPKLDLAFTAARRLAAHVEALFVRPDPRESLPYLGEGLSTAVVQDIIDAASEAARKAGAAALKHFEEAAGLAHVPVLAALHGPGAASARLREAEGPVLEILKEHAKLADLIVFGRSDGAVPEFQGALEECLLSAGRPVLLVPRMAARSVGTRIVVGWDGSLEAAHAITGALPFLASAEAVELLSIAEEAPKDAHFAEVKDFLRLHGVAVTTHFVERKGQPVGSVLLATAERGGADLVVMGGYGHSRLRELLVGGVTRHVLHNAALPILIAH